MFGVNLNKLLLYWFLLLNLNFDDLNLNDWREVEWNVKYFKCLSFIIFCNIRVWSIGIFKNVLFCIMVMFVNERDNF